MKRKRKVNQSRVMMIILAIVLLVGAIFGGVFLYKEAEIAKGPLVVKKDIDYKLEDTKGNINIKFPITNKKDINQIIETYVKDNLSQKLIKDYSDQDVLFSIKMESNFDESVISLITYRVNQEKDDNILDLYTTVVLKSTSGDVVNVDDIFLEEDLKNISMFVRSTLSADKDLKSSRDMYLKTIPKYQSFENFIIKGDTLEFLYRKGYFNVDRIAQAGLGLEQYGDYVKSETLSLFAKNYEQKEKHHVRYIDPNKPMVSLTFDDGPFPPTTRKIGEKFAQKGERVTFFTLGTRVQENADFVKEMSGLGHEIANHSLNHPNLTTVTDQEFKTEVLDTADKIREITGQETVALRPPYGAYDEEVVKKAQAPVIMWNVDTLDWSTRDVTSNKVALNSALQDGNIILMHDIYDTSADSVVEFIDGYQGDVQFVTINELLSYKGLGADAGKVYFAGE